MKSFAVKHIVSEQGVLFLILETVRKQPYSLTNKHHEAHLAAQGENIYVIEVTVELNQRVYRLGYRYKACECYAHVGKLLWKGKFKFKNAANPVMPEGIYFKNPVLIMDPDFNKWYVRETLGMIEIPEQFVSILELLISDPTNNALPF